MKNIIPYLIAKEKWNKKIMKECKENMQQQYQEAVEDRFLCKTSIN